jgi:hypothetical protein
MSMGKEALMKGNNELFVELRRAKDEGREIYTCVVFNSAALEWGSKIGDVISTSTLEGETPKFTIH